MPIESLVGLNVLVGLEGCKAADVMNSQFAPA